MGKPSYEVSRKQACRMLRVTTRTLDRYVRSGKLSAVRSERGRVFFSRKEIMAFKRGKPLEAEATMPIMPDFPIRVISRREELEPSSYQKLYEQALRLIDEKEKKLEEARYRIGQLEARFLIKPLSKNDELNDNELEERLKREILNRKIVTVLLYVVLAIQPVILWYFLSSR